MPGVERLTLPQPADKKQKTSVNNTDNKRRITLRAAIEMIRRLGSADPEWKLFKLCSACYGQDTGGQKSCDRIPCTRQDGSFQRSQDHSREVLGGPAGGPLRFL